MLDTDARRFLPLSSSKVAYELNGNKVNGTFDVSADGTFNLKLDTKRSDPTQAKIFMSELIPHRTPSMLFPPLFGEPLDPGFQTPEFSMKVKRGFTERRGEVALLRIGYLLAFATLGNSFLINGGLIKVREQLQYG